MPKTPKGKNENLEQFLTLLFRYGNSLKNYPGIQKELFKLACAVCSLPYRQKTAAIRAEKQCHSIDTLREAVSSDYFGKARTLLISEESHQNKLLRNSKQPRETIEKELASLRIRCFHVRALLIALKESFQQTLRSYEEQTGHHFPKEPPSSSGGPSFGKAY